MKFYIKLGVYLLMFVPAAVIASIYGLIHDQISYTFSSEYFTHFKFIQFAIPWAQESPRLGAALVGALATWWMGVLVFVVLGLFGFMYTSPRQMVLELIKSFGIVVIVALITGIAGLVYGYFQVNQSSISHYDHWVSPGVTDPIQFVRVGFMHNASYLGGLTGLFAGIIFLLLSKSRRNKKLRQGAK